jgi:polysaccharide deacetylase family protein (PEP-CTERM system associated)
MDGSQLLERADPDSHIASWRQCPESSLHAGLNAMSVDVEDYFQVEAFAGVIDPASWPSRECRIEANVHRILDLFAAAGVRGTFFTLAWIAERYPKLVRAIVADGHELASHGTRHRRVDHQTPEEFFADVAHAKRVLEDIAGVAVKGYRAPSFSLTRASLWAHDVLARADYRYSSSVYPIAHDTYGIPEAPRFAFRPLGGDFLEIPVTSVQWAGRNWPCGGGGYFRLLPYGLSRLALATVDRRDRQPLVFYFHPWEIDPGQPRVAGAPLKSRLRHYVNLAAMESKLGRLMRAFRWGRMDEIFVGGAR